MADSTTEQAPPPKKESKVRDIEALRARIAQAQQQARGKNTVWDSMKQGMTKVQRSGGKLEGMQKAVAETGASLKTSMNCFQGCEEMKESMAWVGKTGSLLERIELWKQHSLGIIAVVVLVAFLIVGGSFMVQPSHMGDVEVTLAVEPSSPTDGREAAVSDIAANWGTPEPSAYSPEPAADSYHIPSSPIVKDVSLPYAFEDAVKAPWAGEEARKEVAETRKDMEEEKKEAAAKIKTSPKERRLAAREQILLDKVEQHVSEYKTRLVEKLHEKKSDPDSLFKSSTLDSASTASSKKTGRKDKSGRK